MSNENKGLVPKLRFSEFKESGEWELLPLEAKADLLSGFPFKSAEISEDPKGIPILRGINITEGYIRHSFDMDRYFLGDVNVLKKYQLQVDDLVIGMDGSKVGKNSALISEKDSGSLLIQRVARLRANCKATMQFIFQHIHSSKFHSYVDRINTSGGIPHISAKQINEFEIYFPPVERELQKIADCLSSLDALIGAQAEKVDALKTHKKALMQQLFPREGETVPRLRFPEFRDSGEWDLKPLEEILSIGSGKDYKHLSDGDIPVYGSGGYMRQVNDYLYEGESVCIGRKGTIDKPMFLNGKFWTVDTLFYTHSFKDAEPKFVYALFQNIQWLKHNEAGGVPSLSKTNIEKIEVAIPKQNEQQKIADCLSSLDELIAAEADKLDALKTHKKGLMQQLSPALDEVVV